MLLCQWLSSFPNNPVTVVPQLLSAQNRTETRWIQSTNALGKKVILSRNKSLNRRKTQLSSCQPVIFTTFHFISVKRPKPKSSTNSLLRAMSLQCFFTQPFVGNPLNPLGGIHSDGTKTESPGSPTFSKVSRAGISMFWASNWNNITWNCLGLGTVLNEPALRVLAFENVYIKWKFKPIYFI